MLLMSVGMFLLCGCGSPSLLKPFKTELTAEEHVERITERTVKFAECPKDESRPWLWINADTVTSFTVEIVWSFDENPEYFLVEFKGNFLWGSEHAYLMGYIYNDAYYTYGERSSESPFKEQGYEDEKKYFGYGVMAVKEGDQFLCILYIRSGRLKLDPGSCISKSDRKYLATHDNRMSSQPY